MKRPVVRVDPDLSDLVPGFLEHKRADTIMLMEAVRRADFDSLVKAAHKIKGEGGSYGFDEITEIGAEIERAGIARDATAARKAIEELTEYLESVDVVYE